ncbi:hypothetical protein G6F40_016339 [Rhizopus arrhizus]|nr:hypothetical protein G6F40_016339 [Rhizopus arrhizus]
MRRFRIEGDVELGGRGDVAVAGDRAAHHHDALDALGQGRVQLQRKRQVGAGWPAQRARLRPGGSAAAGPRRRNHHGHARGQRRRRDAAADPGCRQTPARRRGQRCRRA